jgi:hypothetical protein
MKKVVVASLAVFVMMLWGCAQPPQQQIDEAKAALDVVVAEAQTYAPEALKAAQDKAAALEAELAVQKGKLFKNYKLTTQMVDELKQLAETAKTDAEQAKAKAKAEAEAAIAEAEAAVAAARNALANAPKGKGTAPDLTALTGDVDAAAASVEGAKADLQAEKFSDVNAKAMAAKGQADKVSADIQAAIEMQAATKQPAKKGK